MKQASVILCIIFASLGLYVLLLATEAETSQKVGEIASFSVVFWLPAALFYVLGHKKEESK